MPNYGVDIALVTHSSDALEKRVHWETKSGNLVLLAALTLFADYEEEAATMTSPWDHIPEHIAGSVQANVPIHGTTWTKLFDFQDLVLPPQDRWQCDSIVTDKNVTYKAVRKMLYRIMSDTNVLDRAIEEGTV